MQDALRRTDKTGTTFIPLGSPVDAIIARLAKNFTPEQVAAAYAAVAEANRMPASDRRLAGTACVASRRRA